MIKIPTVSTRFRTQHYERCEALFNAVITRAGFNAQAETGVAFATALVDYFSANLRTILTGSPADLLRIIGHVEVTFPAFSNYCAPRPRSGSARYNAAMEKLCALIEQLFNYNAFRDDTTGCGAYALIREYNQRLCPYCQLHHVNYHVHAGKRGLSMRPPLDHFYPQTKYPYLAVSLSNLVPACHQCNSGVKRAEDPRSKSILHPLEQHPLVDISLTCNSALPPSRIKSIDDFSIELQASDIDSQNFMEFFELEARYKWYGAEVLDLYRRYQRYIDVEPSLRQAVRRSEYLLGFAPYDARERAAGKLLLGVVEKLP